MTIRTVLFIVLCNMSSFRASKVLISLFALELGASQFYIGIMIAMCSRCTPASSLTGSVYACPC
jgi:hypothetical protein